MANAKATDRFLILAAYRSGSTWLADVLNHVPDVRVNSELFLPRAALAASTRTRVDASETSRYLAQTLRSYPHYYESGDERQAIRPFSVFRYLDDFYGRSGTVGFKLMYTQLALHPEVWLYVKARGVCVVHLIRGNSLDMLISRAVRRQTKTTHRVKQEAPPVVHRRSGRAVALDTDRLVEELRALERNVMLARWLLRASGVAHLHVYYEDLVRVPACFEWIWRFLEINPERQAPQSRLTKLVRAGYRETIENYDEVRQTLSGTRFAYLIED